MLSDLPWHYNYMPLSMLASQSPILSLLDQTLLGKRIPIVPDRLEHW